MFCFSTWICFVIASRPKQFVFLERKGKMRKYRNEMWEGDNKKWEKMESEMCVRVWGGGG